MRLRHVLVLAVIAILAATVANAASVTLAWDPTSDPAVAGYKIYYGTVSKAYTTNVDAKKVTTFTVPIANVTTGQTLFFAATAYTSSGEESGFSNEVSWKVPPGNPTGLKIIITVTP